MTVSYEQERVFFDSSGSHISGILFKPVGPIKAAVTFFGPIAFVKEQSPLQYATRMAKDGYASLVFDPRHYGESEGQPRQLEDRRSKVEDIISSVSFLRSLDFARDLDTYAIGICQGANWVAEAAVLDPRIAKVALVASALLSPAMGANYLSEAEVAEKVERGRKALDRFTSSGVVDYMRIGPVEQDRTPAIMPFRHITDWYSPWEIRSDYLAHRGLWENKISSLSEALIWGYDVSDIMSRIEQPILMIHSDKAASGPVVPKEMFGRIPSPSKELRWLDGDQTQYQFYEDPRTIDEAVANIVDWIEA